jgi:haloacetate dehalogenase
MEHLGFREFMIAGHDRGARVGHRLALDYPERILKFASIEIIPTHWQLEKMKWTYAASGYHWFFFAQKYPFPERCSRARRVHIRWKFQKLAGKFSPETWSKSLLRAHPACRKTIARAASITRWTTPTGAGKRVTCPLLPLWKTHPHAVRHRRAWAAATTRCRQSSAVGTARWEAPEGDYRACLFFRCDEVRVTRCR